MKVTKEMRMENGRLPNYAFPGGYPLFYFDKGDSVLCPECANEEESLPSEADINYEDDSLYCDECSRRIESAYAEDDTAQDQQS